MKKELGQFYTSNNDIQDILSNVDILNHDTILEPSVGDGTFYFEIINLLLVNHDISHIVENILTAIDIDNNNIDIIKSILKDTYEYEGNTAQLIHSDFFAYEMKDYSLIIGNPPYISSSKFPKSYIHNIARSLGVDSTNENLYIYFLIRCLQYSDNVVFLIPDNWLIKEHILSKINCHCDIIQYRDRILFSVNSSIQLFIFDKTRKRNIPKCNLKQEILNREHYATAKGLIPYFNDIPRFNQYIHLITLSSPKNKNGKFDLFSLKQNRINNYNYHSIITSERICECTNKVTSQSNFFIKKIIDFLPTMFYYDKKIPFTSNYIGLKNISKYTDLNILTSYRSLPSLLYLELYCKEGTIRSMRTKYPGFFGIVSPTILNNLPVLVSKRHTNFIYNEYKTYDALFADDEYINHQKYVFAEYNLDSNLIPEIIDSIYNLFDFRNRKVVYE